MCNCKRYWDNFKEVKVSERYLKHHIKYGGLFKKSRYYKNNYICKICGNRYEKNWQEV